MNFEELQMKRESCRVYADRPVTREQLVHLVDVARFAPSACNSQPWHFILVDEPESREKVVEAFDDNGLTGCPWGASVPAFILICEEKAQYKPGVEEHYGPQHFAQMDIGMAAMGICYEAASMGPGTCIIGTMNQEKLHRAFGIPEERPVRLIITVGYPANEGAPRKKARKELDEIVTYNQWKEPGAVWPGLAGACEKNELRSLAYRPAAHFTFLKTL